MFDLFQKEWIFRRWLFFEWINAFLFYEIQNSVSDYKRIYPFNETVTLATFQIYMHLEVMLSCQIWVNSSSMVRVSTRLYAIIRTMF